MNPLLKARLGGLFIAGVSAAGAAYNWYSFLNEGRYWVKFTLLAPTFVGLGLALVIHPISKADNLKKYGTEQLPLKHTPPVMWGLMALGLVAGGLNLAYFNGMLSP